MRFAEENLGRRWRKPFYFLLIVFVAVWFCFTFVSFLFPARFVNYNHIDGVRLRRPSQNFLNFFNKTTNTEKPTTTTEKRISTQPRKYSAQYLTETYSQKNVASSYNITKDNLPSKLLDVNYIRRRIFKINLQQNVINDKIFGPVGNHSLVIVIQVHNRPIYLKHLINSLRASQGISNVLLIFSHDYYSEEMNNLIYTIDFCEVLQIFYPYSLQLFPNTFPGYDCNSVAPPTTNNKGGNLNDCPYPVVNKPGQKLRDPKFVQLKHHWWWKANKVFSLRTIKNYEGPVLFLEEDLYMVEDFIPTLRSLYHNLKKTCSRCKILSLAENQDAVRIYTADFSRSNEAIVTSQFSNMGLSFDRSTWNEMLACSKTFCNFNDYNWDFSLQHVFTACMQNTAAATLSAPRLFHLGTCGMHFNSNDCDSSKKIAEIRRALSRYDKNLYPEELDIFYMEDHRRSDVSYGGWEDVRDHSLCLTNTFR